MSAQRARRAHLAHDPRLDDGAAGAVVEEPRRGKARGSATPKRAAAPLAAPRETAGPLRGLERLRQERLCTRRARRTDAAWTDAKIVVSGHLGLIRCQKMSSDNAFRNIARCGRYCVTQQRAITTRHRCKTALDQSNCPIAQIVCIPVAFRNALDAEQNFRNFAGNVPPSILESSARMVSVSRWRYCAESPCSGARGGLPLRDRQRRRPRPRGIQRPGRAEARQHSHGNDRRLRRTNRRALAAASPRGVQSGPSGRANPIGSAGRTDTIEGRISIAQKMVCSKKDDQARPQRASPPSLAEFSSYW